jgi:hypothetical protein
VVEYTARLTLQSIPIETCGEKVCPDPPDQLPNASCVLLQTKVYDPLPPVATAVLGEKVKGDVVLRVTEPSPIVTASCAWARTGESIRRPVRPATRPAFREARLFFTAAPIYLNSQVEHKINNSISRYILQSKKEAIHHCSTPPYWGSGSILSSTVSRIARNIPKDRYHLDLERTASFVQDIDEGALAGPLAQRVRHQPRQPPERGRPVEAWIENFYPNGRRRIEPAAPYSPPNWRRAPRAAQRPVAKHACSR